jgi:hypothetical protein
MATAVGSIRFLLQAFAYFVELVGDEPVRLAVNAG